MRLPSWCGPPPLACRKMACAGGPPALVWGPPCLPSSLGGGGPGSSKDQPWCGFPPACLSSRWRLREQQGSGEAMGACGPPAGRGRDSALAGLFRSPPTLHTARLCGLCQPSGNGLYTLRGKGLPQLAGFCSWHATSRQGRAGSSQPRTATPPGVIADLSPAGDCLPLQPSA